MPDDATFKLVSHKNCLLLDTLAAKPPTHDLLLGFQLKGWPWQLNQGDLDIWTDDFHNIQYYLNSI